MALGIYTIENVPPAYEPSVVKRMAKSLGATEGSGKGIWVVLGLAAGLLGLSYWDCRRRGYCGTQFQQARARARR
jgi:hypothetical protein